MLLLSFENVSIAFGRQPVLEQARFQIDVGEPVCLIGRNGAGKSTLLKIAEGEVLPDAGDVWRQPGLKISRLSQALPSDDDASVFDVVASSFAETGCLFSHFHHVSYAVVDEASLLKRMDQLQHLIDTCDGWSVNQRISMPT
jgi:ATP-binding cassette subfamily F protein uup